MKKIYYQTWSHPHYHIDHYQVKNTVQKITINDRVEEILFTSQHQSDSIFLLDEKYFDLLSCHIEGSFYQPLRIDQLEHLVDQKIKEFKKNRQLSGEVIHYTIDHSTIDWEKTAYILGKTGLIQFQLSLLGIKPALLSFCPEVKKNKKSWLQLYPASYFTVQFISHSLEKPYFNILSIHEDHAKLIHISHGRYQSIETLDRWYHHIKEMCSKNNILPYFHKSDAELQSNPIAHQIMQQSMDFYNKMLVERLANYSMNHEDIIVIAPELKHHTFRESFTTTYHDKINGYVVPFSITSSLQQFGRKRQPHELDVLTCINSIS